MRPSQIDERDGEDYCQPTGRHKFLIEEGAHIISALEISSVHQQIGCNSNSSFERGGMKGRQSILSEMNLAETKHHGSTSFRELICAPLVMRNGTRDA
jgi:hypothetical protein